LKHRITKKSQKLRLKRVTALRKNHVKTSLIRVVIVLGLGHGISPVNVVGLKSVNIVEKVVLEIDIVVVPETDILVDGLKISEVVHGLQSNYLSMDHPYLLLVMVGNNHL
jgi:hypothetical protein